MLKGLEIFKDWSGGQRLGEKGEPELILLSGFSGAGKTTRCLELNQQARLFGIPVCGLVSPTVFVDGQKVAIDLLDLQSEERRTLAISRSHDSPAPFSGPATEGWQFDVAAFKWGNEIISRISSTTIFILDEPGPLEFTRQEGLLAGISFVDSRRYQLACATIRPQLLPIAQVRWPWGRVVEVAY